MKLPDPMAARRSCWTFEDAVKGMSELAALAHGAVRAFACAPLLVPWFEAKVAIGLHLEPIVNLYVQLEERRLQLRKAANDCAGICDPLLARMPTLGAEEALALIYGSLLDELIRALERYLASVDHVLDYPSLRIIQNGLASLQDAEAWGKTAVSEIEKLDLAVAPRQTCSHSQRTKPELCSVERPKFATRDASSPSFGGTRNYRAIANCFTGDEYSDRRLELAWINRDEIDAVETFGLVIFDLLDYVPLAMIGDLARSCSDEARHAWTGRALIDALGHSQEDLPVSVIGIGVRAQMTGWQALTQITMFGELGIIRPMLDLANSARSHADTETANAFDFIANDELLHLRTSSSWIRRNHPAGSVKAAEEEAQRVAGSLLERAGILGEDYYITLTKAEIFEILGE
jgi:hypothetical protein